jgi:two-component system chemotaxis response regulator CheY
MILGSKDDDTQFTEMLPAIISYPDEWQIFSAVLPLGHTVKVEEIIQKVLLVYNEQKGLVFKAGDRKAVCILNLGRIGNYAALRADIKQKLADNACWISVKKASESGLNQMRAELFSPPVANKMSLFAERERRRNNVLMVADDDMFVRKVIKQALKNYGKLVEADNGNDVIGHYIRSNPDMLLLDIHMPGPSGLELIDKIMDADPDAYIVITSADSVKENVLVAMEKGAVGFLGKPFQDEKIVAYIQKCITIKTGR